MWFTHFNEMEFIKYKSESSGDSNIKALIKRQPLRGPLKSSSEGLEATIFLARLAKASCASP